MRASPCMSRRFMASTTTTLLNPASRVSRGLLALRSPSIPDRKTRFPPPRAALPAEYSAMNVYTVHLKGSKDDLAALERAVFVREGFSWAALIVGPLWLLWNRLWLALIVWL